MRLNLTLFAFLSDYQAIAGCFKKLEQAFETSLAHSTSKSKTEMALIDRLCGQLGLSVPLSRSAIYVVTKVRSIGILDGRDPSTVAGGCILFTTRLFGEVTITADLIENVAGVKAATIKAAFE